MQADAITEEFLFCESFSETIKASDVLQMGNNFFAKQDFNWKRSIRRSCTDGAPAMLGKSQDLLPLIKKEVPHIIVTICFLHQDEVASKSLSSTFKKFCLFLQRSSTLSEL